MMLHLLFTVFSLSPLPPRHLSTYLSIYLSIYRFIYLRMHVLALAVVVNSFRQGE